MGTLGSWIMKGRRVHLLSDPKLVEEPTAERVGRSEKIKIRGFYEVWNIFSHTTPPRSIP